MEKFLNLTMSGAVTGAIYSMVAAGLVLTYTSTGIFNLGYGAVAFTCAFLYYELHTGLGWSIAPAAIVTVLVFAPLLGWALDRAIFRRLSTANDSAKVMATVGVLVALPALARWIVETLVSTAHWNLPLGNQVFIAPGVGPSPKKVWNLPADVVLDSNQVIVFGVATVSAAGLYVLLRLTPLGLRLRAVVDRPQLAEMRGVDRNRSSAVAWILGTTLAGLAGVVGAPVFNSLDANTYTLVMFVAVAAAVVGGLRSVPLAFAGGLALGVAQNLVAGYATFARGIQGFNAAVPFAVLLIGLAFFGRERVRAGRAARDDTPAPDYLADLTPWRRALPGLIGGALLVTYLLFVADDFWLGITTRGLALALVFLSFVIVTGMGGMVSLAQAAFVTASALTAGLLVNHFDQPYLIGVLGGVAVAVALGMVVAVPALRLGGLALALATLALGFLGDRVLFSWNWFRNRQEGWSLPRPELGPLDLGSDRTFAMVMIALLVLATLAIRNLERSATGRAIAAVRSSEPAAATSGLSPTSAKLVLFGVSAALAGLGGVMLATFDQRAVNATFPASLGLVWLATVALWGIRRPGGAVIAALSAVMFPPLLNGGFHWPEPIPTFLSWNGTSSALIPNILFGLGAIQMARDPDGILSVVSARSAQRRARRRMSDDVAQVAAEAETVDAADVRRHERVLETVGAVRVASATDAEDDDAAPPLLVLSGIVAGYGPITVLHGIDLSVRAGRVTALVGANGAGKSTLCSVIGGTLPPTGGTMHLDGRDISRAPAHQRARLGLLVAPESRGIFPALTVEENLALRLRSRDGRDAAFSRFPRLAERRRLPAGSLSGGEQQLLALAPLLVEPPAVLVADEPTLGLAPLIVENLLEVFTELRDRGVALLLVEEKARAILDVADDVALIELGHLAWSGRRADVDDERLASTYLGQPATV